MSGARADKGTADLDGAADCTEIGSCWQQRCESRPQLQIVQVFLFSFGEQYRRKFGFPESRPQRRLVIMITGNGFVQQRNIIEGQVAAIEDLANVIRRVTLNMVNSDRLIVIVANDRCTGFPGEGQNSDDGLVRASLFCFDSFCRKEQGEGAAGAERAVDSNIAAHLVCLLSANGQPQAGATELARDRVVGLLEHIEDFPLCIFRNAGSGVGDRNPNLVMVICRRESASQRDRSGLCKFDSIARQIEQNVADIVELSRDELVAARFRLQGDGQALLVGSDLHDIPNL